MKKLLFAVFTLLVCKVFFVAADPAPRTLFLYSQPDGTSIWIRECGDEYFHWEESEDGFVCTNSAKERIYIQVAYLLAHEDTIEREYGALRSIKDNYPKYVISMTPLVKRNNDEGIIHLGLREFLMNGL